MPRYGLQEQVEALKLYEQGRSLASISREKWAPARKTLDDWKKRGVPEDITDGKPWDEYLADKRQVEINERLEESSVVYQQEVGAFLEQAKEDLQKVYHVVKDRLLRREGEVKPADMEKLLMMFVRLDSQNADRVLKEQRLIREILKIIFNRVADQQIREMIKMDFMQLQDRLIKEAGPNAHMKRLPSPAAVVETVQ